MAVGIAAFGRYAPEDGPAPDEDALTMALEAVRALGALPGRVDCLALASMDLPGRRGVQAGLLAGALGLGEVFVCEHTTSARAGTEALLAQWGLLSARGGVGLTVEVAPGHGAAALLLAEGGGLAAIDGFASVCAEDPGLELGVPDYVAACYTRALTQAARCCMDRLGTGPEAYRHLVLNPPVPRLGPVAARAVGCSAQQTVTVAAVPLLGLTQVLPGAAPGERVLLLAYGSGSACDAISLTVGRGARTTGREV
ncbi:MAG: hypothetical protein K0R39_3161 [Symbiobacteriaceae bacterium]|jgi:3-hydroxy-3-methylglutaryl CoA synthase|nr:hypothetical protein [Symbiobacteriaceae bacterium]